MTEGLSPRQQAKRAQIVAAATALFLEQGFAATSMDAITAKARVSKQTLYVYFPTKNELLLTVLSENVANLLFGPPTPRPIDSHEELRASLVNFSTTMTTTLMRPEAIALVRLVLGEVFTVAELRAAFRQTLPGQLLGQVCAVLNRAAALGLITFADEDLAARMFLGPLMTYVALDGYLSANPSAPPPQEKLEHLVDAFLATVTP